MPLRWRSRLMSNVGMPGALAGNGVEGADRICQRLEAALGIGIASTRTSKANTPASAAASDRRRDDVMSIIFALPCASMITADAAFDRMTSADARRASNILAVRMITIPAGSAPMPTSPGAYIRPAILSCFSSPIQYTRRFSELRRSVKSRAKAEAVATSLSCAANISCKALRFNPPLIRSSTQGAPSDNRSTPCNVL